MVYFDTGSALNMVDRINYVNNLPCGRNIMNANNISAVA